MALTDVAIRQAKPGPKQYKVADGEGLYLLVTPAGGKLWRLKYRLAGKEKLMAFGAYPEVSLADARKRRDEARQQLAASKDPSREKQRAKVRQQAEAMNTFAIISAEYCAKRKSDGQGGWSPATSKRSEYLLSRLNAALGKALAGRCSSPGWCSAMPWRLPGWPPILRAIYAGRWQRRRLHTTRRFWSR